MEYADRLEKMTTARFDIKESSSGTLNTIVLADTHTGYRRFVHILAGKGKVGIERAKEDLAIDFITSKGEIYADKIKKHKNEPFGGHRSRSSVREE